MPAKPIIAISMGDPSGIGPEIIIKALKSTEVTNICSTLVIGDRLAMERAISVCSSTSKITEVVAAEEARTVPFDTIPLLALSHLTEADIVFGAPTIAAGDAVYRYIC